MIKTVRTWVLALLFATTVGGSFMTVMTPSTSQAAKCTNRVLTFPTWYRGLGETKGSGAKATCEIKSPADLTNVPKDERLSRYIWTIVLNVIEIAMLLVGYLAVGFIIYGGFIYITGAGASDKIVTGRKLILNAVIGLVISLFAVAIVNIVLGSVS